MHARTFTLVFFCLFLISNALAQTDTLFWFSVPKVAKHVPDTEKTILFRVAAADEAALVRFSQPANSDGLDTTILIPALQSRTLNVTPWLETIENAPNDTITDHGIRIHATAKISVYMEATDSDELAFNPEIYVLKGKAALGELFYLPFQDYWDGGSTPQAFTLVATENNTTIAIGPTNDLINHPAHVPYWIELQKGQSYSVSTPDAVDYYYLSGTKVTSNHPIAITIVDDSVREYGVSTCGDQVGDQITPATTLGTEYVILKGFLGTEMERVFITATEDNTEVYANGSLVATLQTGQLYRHTTSTGQQVLSISTSKPTYAYHVTGIGCEVGGAQLPGLDCRGSRSVQFTRANTENLFLFLLGPEAIRNSFLVNGIPVDGQSLLQFSGPGGNWVGGWVAIDLNWVGAGQNCTVTNSTGIFQLGVLHGGSGSGCRYGYFSDFLQLNAELPERIDTCGSDALTLMAQDLEETAYLWNTGDQTVTTIADTSGWYWVEMSRDNCIDRDSVWVQFDEIAVCESATKCPGNDLAWRGLAITTGGEYEVEMPGLDGDCDTTFYLEVFELPVLVGDTLYRSICAGQEISFSGKQYRESGVYFHASADPDSCGYVQALDLEVLPPGLIQDHVALCLGDSLQIGTEVYSMPGIYQDTLSDTNGCHYIQETTISRPSEPAFAATIFPAIGGANGVILLDAILNENYSFRWSNGGQTPNLGQLSAGTYLLTITDEAGCSFVFDFAVEDQNGFYLPNAFSPNGDGVNDEFQFYTVLDDFEVLSFQVFDRWGGQVFSSTRQFPRWDGQIRGQLAKAGVYTYFIQLNLGAERELLLKGDVLLLR